MIWKRDKYMLLQAKRGGAVHFELRDYEECCVIDVQKRKKQVLVHVHDYVETDDIEDYVVFYAGYVNADVLVRVAQLYCEGMKL